MKRCVLLLLITHLCAAGRSLFASTQTHALVVCSGLNTDYASLNPSGLFPSDLPESNCVAIDVCGQVNNRGQTVPINTWLHRSNPILLYDGETTLDDDSVYNYHSIEYVRLPAGVQVEACAPDFGHWSVSGEYVCDSATIQTLTAACPPLSWSGGAFDLTACLTSVQYDRQGPFVAATTGSTQMMRYSFEEDWGCLTSADTSAGLQLSSDTKPNTLIPCADIPHAIYQVENGCEFTCEAGYTKNDQQCLPNCGDVTALVCEDGEKAGVECTLMTQPRYTCEPCPVEAGKRTLPWNAAQPTVCVYEACPAGTFGDAGICTPCPVNYYSGVQASACEPCAHGYHQPLTGQESCVLCFTESMDTSNVCDDGEMLLRDTAALDQYYLNLTAVQQETYTLLAFCAQGYACVPCKPGHYESEQTCQPCAHGYYQPNFKMTTCFGCSAGQNTTSMASKSVTECVCNPGFE